AGFVGIGVPNCTILRLQQGITADDDDHNSGYSPDNTRFDFYIARDGFDGSKIPNQGLTFVEWGQGIPAKDTSGKLWDIRFAGNIAQVANAVNFVSPILSLGNNIPSDNIWFDVTNLEFVPPAQYAGFHWEESGSWRRLRRDNPAL